MLFVLLATPLSSYRRSTKAAVPRPHALRAAVRCASGVPVALHRREWRDVRAAKVTSAALFLAEVQLKFRFANHGCCNWTSFRAHATHSSELLSADWLPLGLSAHSIGCWRTCGAWVWATGDPVHARQPAGRGKAAGSDRTRRRHHRPSDDSPGVPSDQHTIEFDSLWHKCATVVHAHAR
jgi:hypothetical protein